MKSAQDSTTHPGSIIRKHVLPPGMSVTDAAKRLGVGRPALSNLLNGNASLSHEMAVRLEKTFGADSQHLHDLQSAFDRRDRHEEELSIAVGAYVPPFLTIKARQIEEWAENNLTTRQELPVLLRKLIYSTGRELHQVDFPGNDNAERKGWDGLVDTRAATPWIPEGRSCWEFGTNKKPGLKAEKDYASRLRSVSLAERRESTFVFVTPRNWHGKSNWVRDKQATGDWKAVRAFDASDLEQWLELSISGQIWLAERLGVPGSGLETPDQFWERWSAASDPKITPAIFDPSILAYSHIFKKWLGKESDRPFVVAADSVGEALAFLACLLRHSTIGTQWRDIAAVFESADALRALAASNAPFMPIVFTAEAERELATVYRHLHCIVVRPRNAVISEPDIALDLLNHESFREAVTEMGIDADRIEQLDRESGRSPTILRRRLAKIDAIREPEWAQDAEASRTLIPMALIGAWHSDSDGDHGVMEALADRDYPEIEKSFASMLQYDDAPVWTAGRYRGIASKIDSIFATNKHFIRRDLDDFFLIAELVLSEIDPALELPEGDRWAAELYGKVRNHSTAMRQGICETLVILSVHGNNLFRNRLGIDVEAEVSRLILQLLSPLTLDKLLSHDNDLPHYAEAAPREFLTLLEADLQNPQPEVLGLLKPVGTGVFNDCPRTGLLWALECLAWKNLGRVSSILALLSRTVIDDNWVNKPITSLEALYRAWMPQTAATLQERMTSLEALTKRFPDIGWQICLEQLRAGSRFGNHIYRPRWRSDATGAGQPVKTNHEISEFMRKALDLALAWPQHDQKTLGDLIEGIEAMPQSDRELVWDLIDKWAESKADDNAKAKLAEQIRRFALTQRAQRRQMDEGITDRAHAARDKLLPDDPVTRHCWLFASHWIELSADEIEDVHINRDEHEKKIRKLRSVAMKEVWAERGFDGVITLLGNASVGEVLGDCLAPIITDTGARSDFLRACLSGTSEVEFQLDGCMRSFLWSLDNETRGSILLAVTEGLDTDHTLRLLKCAPFKEVTWRLLDRYEEECQNRYWREVQPVWRQYSERELMELLDRLLEANRPRAAFDTVHMHWEQVETSRLKRLLHTVGTVDEEPAGHYRLDPYMISEALESLDGRAGVSPDEMAQLEFLYIEVLDGSEHGIPNLEGQIAKSPDAFVRVLALAFKRQDHAQDPAGWRIEDPDRRDGLASAAYSLLHQMKLLPGTGTNGEIDTEVLFAWVTTVRQLCRHHARADIGDHYIGQILSQAPTDEDGIWPCRPVCEVMERIASSKIGAAFNSGVYNARGAHWRGEGGAQERELATKYRVRSKHLAFDYPHVSSVLENIAVGYDREAEWHDEQAKIDKRLQH